MNTPEREPSRVWIDAQRDNSVTSWRPVSNNANEWVRWIRCPPGVYRCRVCVEPELEGGFSAYVPGLPGVLSDGDNETEALEHITEALIGALQAYRDGKTPIPWAKEELPVGDDAISKWIVVHA